MHYKKEKRYSLKVIYRVAGIFYFISDKCGALRDLVPFVQLCKNHDIPVKPSVNLMPYCTQHTANCCWYYIKYQGSKSLGPHIQPKQKSNKKNAGGWSIEQNLEKGGG